MLIPKIIHQVYEDMIGPPAYLVELAKPWSVKISLICGLVRK